MIKRISWATKLEMAKARGKFTKKEKDDADNWGSCAIGEKHHFENMAESEAKIYYQWSESQEYKFGLDFMYAVADDDIARAQEIYAKILALPVWEYVEEKKNAV